MDATNANDNHDPYNASDVGGQTDGDPERATSPSRLDTLPSPSHEQDHSGFTDTSEHRETYYEEESNPYGNNYIMAEEESKESLVLEPRGRSTNYQELGACSPHSFPYSPAC